VVTLFSVRSGCDVCKSVQANLAGVQYSYAQTDERTFFGVLFYQSEDSSREVFAYHEFRTVPYLCTSKQQL
jgi:glutaredoxin